VCITISFLSLSLFLPLILIFYLNNFFLFHIFNSIPAFIFFLSFYCFLFPIFPLPISILPPQTSHMTLISSLSAPFFPPNNVRSGWHVALRWRLGGAGRREVSSWRHEGIDPLSHVAAWDGDSGRWHILTRR
jgi:hypothetical protein